MRYFYAYFVLTTGGWGKIGLLPTTCLSLPLSPVAGGKSPSDF